MLIKKQTKSKSSEVYKGEKSKSWAHPYSHSCSSEEPLLTIGVSFQTFLFLSCPFIHHIYAKQVIRYILFCDLFGGNFF